MTDKLDPNKTRIRYSPAFKLKDRNNRHFMTIPLKSIFGFLPETIIIQKIYGSNNKIQVIAVLTPEEVIKEDKILVEKEKKNKELKKTINNSKK